MTPLYWFFAFAGIALQIFLVYSLTAKRYSIRLPYLYAYSIILVSTVGIDLTLRIIQSRTSTSTLHVWRYYWCDDFVRQLSLFLVVISLLYVAAGNSPGTTRLRKQATAAVVVMAIASGLYFRGEPLGTWATEVVRNVSFAVVIVNVVLWSALIRSGAPERLPLMLSAGVGLQMAGEAMGQALRSSPMASRFPFVIMIGNLILILSHILCLLTWLHALRADERRLAAASQRAAETQPAGDPSVPQDVVLGPIAGPEFRP